MQTFTTAAEAKEMIVNTLGDFVKDHDIDAIYDETFAWQDGKLVQTVTEDEFWTIVAKHAND